MERLVVLICLTTFAGVFSLSAKAQDQTIPHAPSVEQCRADAAVWVDMEYKKPPLSQLNATLGEVLDCMKVDPIEHGGSSFWKYQQVNIKITSEYMTRMQDFISRHDLDNQFKSEDAQGKR